MIVALSVAGLINLSMLVIAASLFHSRGMEIETIEAAHAGLGSLIGGGAALAFAVALLASGLSSSSVGTYSGQVVMQGFLRRRIPLLLRRLVTMLPALVVLAIGVDTTQALVLSQVVLSFGIPFALVPTILLTRRARRDGRARQQAGDDRRGDRGRHADHRAERLPALPDVLRLSHAADGISPCGLSTYFLAAPWSKSL